MSVMPRRSRRTAPRRSAGCSRGISLAIWSRPMPALEGHGGRGEHVQQVAASEERRFDRPVPDRRLDVGAHAANAAVANVARANGCVRSPRRTSAPCPEICARSPSRVDRRRCRPARCRRPRPRGSRPWHRQWRPRRQRSRDARRRHSSTRAHLAPQSRRAC